MNITQRKHGRMVFETETNIEKLEAFNWIIENKSFAIINKITVDGWSASIVIAVINNLSEENKQKLLNLSIQKIIAVAYKLFK